MKKSLFTHIFSVLFFISISLFFNNNVNAQLNCGIQLIQGFEVCNGNNTHDIADDVYDVFLLVDNFNPGPSNMYFVDDGVGTYGPFMYDPSIPSNFIVPADGMPHNFQIFDLDDPTCVTFYASNIPFDPCSPTCTDGMQNGDETGIDCGGNTCLPCTGGQCDLVFLGIQEDCDGADTHDVNDDVYQIYINYDATNPGISNQFVVIWNANSFGPFDYGIGGVIILPATNNNEILTIEDADDPACSDVYTTVTLFPCSPTCMDNLQNGDETGVDCGGATCTPCSCEVIVGQVIETCNGYDTHDTSDDDYSIELGPDNMFGGSYNILWNGIPLVTNEPYGNVVTVVLPATGNNEILIIEDSVDPNCNEAYTTNTLVPCSPTCTDGILNGDETGIDCGGANCPSCITCDITIGQVLVDCNGQNTHDVTDDIYTVEFTAFNSLGVDYQVLWNGNILSTGSYGTPLVVTLPATGNTEFLEIIDQLDPTCTSTITLNALIPCSPTCTDGIMNGDETGVDCGGTTCQPCGFGGQCNINLLNYQEDCFGNDTHDPFDDTYNIFVILDNPTAGLSNSYTIMWNGNNMGSFSYLSPASILLPASGISEVLDFIDNDDPNCVFIFQTNQLIPCSPTCDDGIMNGDETDIDCGGATCGPCGCDYPDNIIVDLGMDPNRVTISWDAVPGAQSYQIRYRRALTSAWTNVVATSTSKVIQVLVQNKVYDYRVRAKCADGSWSPLSPIDKFRTVQCLAPVNLIHTQLNNNKVRVEWDNYAYSDKYQVFYREAGSSDPWQKKVTYYAGMNFRVLNGLTPNMTYEWKVRSWCEVSYGPFTDLETFTNVTLREVSVDALTLQSLSPNPATTDLMINFLNEKDGEIQLTITNLIGKQVYISSKNYMKGMNQEKIDISQLNQGYYILLMTDGEKTITSKFIKSN